MVEVTDGPALLDRVPPQGLVRVHGDGVSDGLEHRQVGDRVGVGEAPVEVQVVGLGLGAVFAANMFFFAGVRRIQAAPTSIAASIEPVVGTLLALLMFGQGLTLLGWLGLALVVGGVAAGYAETEEDDVTAGPVRVAQPMAPQ